MGWAVCDGTAPYQQDIKDSVLQGNTPDLTGRFLKGMKYNHVAKTELNERFKQASTLRLHSNHKGNAQYSHSEVEVPLDGKKWTDKGKYHYLGNRGSSGPYDTSVLEINWTQEGGPLPSNYEVVYIMLVK